MSIDMEQVMVDPAAVFGSPDAVVERRDLSSAQKVAILRRWLEDARELAVAEEEGMGGGEPSLLERVSAAKLAEERRMNEQLERAEVDREAFLDSARAELRQLDGQIADLQHRREGVAARVRRFNEASGAVLDDLRDGFERAADGVREAVRSATARDR
jgi:hypothetical protein